MVLSTNSNPTIYQRASVTDVREESKTGIFKEMETAETPENIENEQIPSERPHQKTLSKRELIVRRSLVLIAAIAVLMIGILIRLCV